MKIDHRSGIRGTNQEQTFLPPIYLEEDPDEVWGPAWDAQVAAAQSWQTAGNASVAGKTTGSAQVIPSLDEVMATVGGAAAEYERPPTMRTISGMNTLLLCLRERLLQIQTAAANVAIAERSARSGAASDAAPTTAGEEASVALADANAQKIQALIDAWFAITASAQAGMNGLTGRRQVFARSSVRSAIEGARLRFDRRRADEVIRFPDRRQLARA